MLRKFGAFSEKMISNFAGQAYHILGVQYAQKFMLGECYTRRFKTSFFVSR